MAGRPPKPVAVLKAEGKSHRTKAELAQREEAENSLVSHKELFERSEVVNNDIAHQEFVRIAEIMREIGKNDAMYSSGVNTCCLLYAEIIELQEQVKILETTFDSLRETFDRLIDDPDGGMNADKLIQFEKSFTKLISQKLSVMSMIDKKRKMMLDIDKENAMTVSAALRAIPKTPEKLSNSEILTKLLDSDDDDE